jgi:hypothetical protein
LGGDEEVRGAECKETVDLQGLAGYKERFTDSDSWFRNMAEHFRLEWYSLPYVSLNGTDRLKNTTPYLRKRKCAHDGLFSRWRRL